MYYFDISPCFGVCGGAVLLWFGSFFFRICGGLVLCDFGWICLAFEAGIYYSDFVSTFYVPASGLHYGEIDSFFFAPAAVLYCCNFSFFFSRLQHYRKIFRCRWTRSPGYFCFFPRLGWTYTIVILARCFFSLLRRNIFIAQTYLL